MRSATRWISFGLVALLAMLTTPCAVMAAPSPTDAAAVREQVGKVYDWAGYQRDLPDAPVRSAPPPEGEPLSLDLRSIIDALLIGGLVVVLVGLAMWLRASGWAWPSARDAVRPEEAAASGAQRDHLKARLDDADRSAVSGDWSGAIHVLLLTSIDLLRRRVGQEVPVAMTARELVGRARVPEQARDDFAALVAAVELCHFGGRPADRPLYERCRGYYERLWGMPPEEAA
ncbi:MAG: DUF4129 domain-containing protein [Reyranella sp.]|nr:DUF4129 domain-containing protein [Reyranella sp.]